MKKSVFLVAVLFALANPAVAEEVSNWDRFKLWNKCNPLNLVVSELHEDAQEIGLSEENIQATVENRLRGAGIYDSRKDHEKTGENRFSPGILLVDVIVIKYAFSINLSLMLPMARLADIDQFRSEIDGFFYKYPYVGFATLWSTRTTGTHVGDAGYIVQNVDKDANKFVSEYLRVNAEACG